MKIERAFLADNENWEFTPDHSLVDADMVIYFGEKSALSSDSFFDKIKSFYPNAAIMGCSSGGEIYNDEVYDYSVVLIAIKFSKTTLKTASETISSAENSFTAGIKIAQQLNSESLKSIFILSDGININGTDLINGIYSIVDKDVILTGGLAGDGDKFESTLVGLNATPITNNIVAIGFYGESLHIGYGSMGGWEEFGIERKITKSEGNILYQLDGKPALDLYKEYLGKEAEKLPASALIYPLKIWSNEKEKDSAVVRTIVGINSDDKSLIFASDITEGYSAQLMHGIEDNLIAGATKAAQISTDNNTENNGFSLIVSCIGRKLLLGQRISNEIEGIYQHLNEKFPLIGFYSYGEICHQSSGDCSLHNQTMTITVMYES